MDQADSVHSTPPTNTPIDTTRRRFLSQAAAVAAGGAAGGMALPLPYSKDPGRVPDPILEAIGAHRAATAGVNLRNSCRSQSKSGLTSAPPLGGGAANTRAGCAMDTADRILSDPAAAGRWGQIRCA